MVQFDRYFGSQSAYRPSKDSVYVSSASSGWGQSANVKTKGKWYLEYTIVADDQSAVLFGFTNMLLPHGFNTGSGFPVGFDLFALYRYDNSIYHGGALAYTNVGWGTGSVVRMGLDCNTGTLYYAIDDRLPTEITQYRASAYNCYVPTVAAGSSSETYTVTIAGERNTCKFPAFAGFGYWGEGKVSPRSLLVTSSIQQSLGVR